MSVKLARNLNFIDIYLISLGHIIGAGIFILISKSAKHAKNYTWLAFLIAGILSILNAFTYMDLSTVFKTNSAEFDYISKALGRPIGLISALIILLMGIFSTTTVTLGTGEYINKLFGFPKILSAILLIVIFTIINIIGVKTSATVNGITTSIETIALLVIIIGGFLFINKKSNINKNKSIINQNRNGSNDSFMRDINNNYSGILYAALIAMFAYTGFETTVKLTEEAKNPNRDIPLALIASVITSIFLYTAIAYLSTYLIDTKVFAKSVTPIADLARIIFGEKMYKIFTIVALISISNTVLSSILGNSRLLCAISDYYPQLNIFKSINDTTKTPINSIIAIALASIIALSIKNVEKSSVISSCLFFVILTLVNLSLIIMHFNKEYKNVFNTPWSGSINKNYPILPIFAFITSLLMIGFCSIKR